MREDEFFAELRKIDGWTIDSQIIRRSQLTDFTGGYTQYDCPVCAVAHSLGSQKFGNRQFDEAADYLGMDQELAYEIVDASDIAYERMPNSRQGELRSKLLEATGNVE